MRGTVVCDFVCMDFAVEYMRDLSQVGRNVLFFYILRSMMRLGDARRTVNEEKKRA